MPSNFVVPNIYRDISNQMQGYFAFEFYCQICGWAIETTPIRSQIATTQTIMDIGVGMLGGFWGRAAQAGEQLYGTQWHREQAGALQKSWEEIKQNFHDCPKCHSTVCTRCFNIKLNLCVNDAPDLRADAAAHLNELNVQAQREQIEAHYSAPQFNIDAVPSAVDEGMLRPPQNAPQPMMSPGGYPSNVPCPSCHHLGVPGKFCEDCGAKIPWPDLFCPQCATQVSTESHFCPECGAKLQQAN